MIISMLSLIIDILYWYVYSYFLHCSYWYIICRKSTKYML